ncbi:hypothetical protein chiPu_0002808 [Chiloscyllium punctatum]|uniref:Uncharacterized protein n=1 Tax=Chiloscyllium punctatum TaxID=137246 RepID=A0A401S1Z5_CHIPU|nr:hypothetical protein [Chiloscyllium punctatum]
MFSCALSGSQSHVPEAEHVSPGAQPEGSRDAEATLLNIYTETSDEIRGGFMMCFLDNGIGMNPRMDFILFTKKDNTMTCILISRTFYEKEGIDEVIVPMPSWYVATKEPIMTDKEKFSIEIALIHKYSPFKNESHMMQQFNKITGASGTLVVIYNMKLNDDGVPELDIETDASDILLTGMIASGMKYIYMAKGFKVRALREVKDAEHAVKIDPHHSQCWQLPGTSLSVISWALQQHVWGCQLLKFLSVVTVATM